MAFTILTLGITTSFGQSGVSPQWVLPAINAPRVQHRTFDSAAAKSKVSYHIYTPESYDMDTQQRFPVLYWLHGSGGGIAGVPQLARHFDSAIRAGKIPPMLVVFPNGLPNGMWCDWKDGSVPMETIVMKELIPHIEATFRTIAAREGRIIEGFSMGGYGAGVATTSRRCGVPFPFCGAIGPSIPGIPTPIPSTSRTTLTASLFGCLSTARDI